MFASVSTRTRKCRFCQCRLALHDSTRLRVEVTVTSHHPPRLCRIAVFSIKPAFLSCVILSKTHRFSCQSYERVRISRPRGRGPLIGQRFVVPHYSRGDRKGVGEDQVTLTSEFQEQAERTKKKQGKRVLHPVEAQTKVRSRVNVAQSRGRPARDRGRA